MKNEYFIDAKYIQDVRSIMINNLSKLNNTAFIEEFKKAYNNHISDQYGPYGSYTRKADVSAEQFIDVARFINALCKIKINNKKIRLGISFKLGGINIHGDTKPIKDILKAAKFRWNSGTQEWWNKFQTMPALPEVPNFINDTSDANHALDSKETEKSPVLNKDKKLAENKKKVLKARKSRKNEKIA